MKHTESCVYFRYDHNRSKKDRVVIGCRDRNRKQDRKRLLGICAHINILHFDSGACTCLPNPMMNQPSSENHSHLFPQIWKSIRTVEGDLRTPVTVLQPFTSSLISRSSSYALINKKFSYPSGTCAPFSCPWCSKVPNYHVIPLKQIIQNGVLHKLCENK